MTATGPSPRIRTVLGDIPPAELGTCDAHDHLFLRSPRLPGQELDDVAAAEAELRAFAALGGSALVQWTPAGMGRRADALPALSRATGVHLVAATGLHQAHHYAPELLPGLTDRLTERLVTDVTEGVRPGGGGPGPAAGRRLDVRAGLVKVAGSFHGLDAHARHTFAAAAQAHHATGVPIAVHLEAGTAPGEVLELLCDRHGVPPHRVILGHLGRLPDVRLHLAAARSGAFLAFDGPSRAHHTTDWRLFDSLHALTEAGHADRLLLGGDTTVASARAVTGEGPGLPYLLAGLRPRVEKELGQEAARAFFEANPARAFAVPWQE
ncbi:phosphotriesterase [Streptomyces sp. NPDC059740]|uniref:phosphotriesterase family protein n=1 Tax=Streptomyces sp. NPDC059740 TaxID=3346926 RepID=UPI003646D9E1